MLQGYTYASKKSISEQVEIQIRTISLSLIMTILTFFVCTSKIWFPTRYFHNIQFIVIAIVDLASMLATPIIRWANPQNTDIKEENPLSWLMVRQALVLFLMLWFLIIVFCFYDEYRRINNIYS
ncbi:MAG: hypothetical protein PHP69_07095 [Candidatus Omnitrophica bacterium]|nr:hypothetical protein [Candidatus Omnitrophota bacterium]MDD5081710.1 hypothetical protein [Candidatus Omnitrophota bacterium]MDD5441399.1 hypothetical protein [Candidatus Omnitrophota bacterium]